MLPDKSQLTFNKKYFVLCIALFVIEICIAKYAHDSIIRPYVGDLLVVILLYCFVRTFLNTNPYKTAIAVLLFAYCIEILQYFQLVKLLGLQQYTLARVLIGTSFEWIDIIAYTIGIALVMLIEKQPNVDN